MGPVEKLLRATNVRRPKQVEKAYGNREAGFLLIRARRELGIYMYDTDLYLADIFSEAIQAAAYLRL